MDIIFLEINWEAPLLQGADDNCSAIITNVNERMKLLRECGTLEHLHCKAK